ncbi:MAG: Mut7-C RNAse domain-containing protein [Gammaproteobacteria bacterium]
MGLRASADHRPAARDGVASFRFYEELNDFLAPERRKRRFEHAFRGPVAVKDVVEALGVPHTEIDLILVNGRSVRFSYRLRDRDVVSVYPVFETLDITPLLRLRPRPLRVSRFVLDAHLGTLARYLRLLGFDTLYRNDYSDAQLARVAHDERRVLLTRDVGLLKRSLVTRGCFLRETAPLRQLHEIVRRLDLQRQIRPFRRCIKCNGLVARIDRRRLAGVVDARILGLHTEFRRCRSCGQIYWPGTHHAQMTKIITAVSAAAQG